MHWSKLVQAAQLYRELQPRVALYYDDYMRTRNAALWASPERLTVQEAKLLIDFINRWATRTPLKPEQIVEAYHVAFSTLRMLEGKRFEDVDLAATLADGETIGDAIAGVFDVVGRCGPRNESTGASKILHTWRPDLFVMWDMRIAAGYGLCRDVTQPPPMGREYADTFLPRLRIEAAEAIATYQGDHGCDAGGAAGELVRLSRAATFPKLLDEYNYAKYTLGADKLWER